MMAYASPFRGYPDKPPSCPAHDSAGDSPHADLDDGGMEKKLPRTALEVSFGKGEKDGKEGDRETVIETGFDVECLTDAGRETLICHHCLSQGCIGGCKHRCNDSRFPDREAGEKDEGDKKTESDREGHADAKESEGQPRSLSQDCRIDPDGIGEKEKGQRHLAEYVDDLAVRRGLTETKDPRSEKDSCGDEDHRCRNRFVFQMVGHEGKEKENRQEESEVCH